MRYIPLILILMASRTATLAARRLLRVKTSALRAAALHAAADDASSIYAIPERAVDEAAVQQLVEKHVAQHATYLERRPIAKHTAAAFQAASEFARSRAAPLIIDAGCGTGRSTLKLAERYPDWTVIGVGARLSASSRNMDG